MKQATTMRGAGTAGLQGLALALIATLAGASAASATELKMAHFMSPKHPMHRFVMAPLAERLAAATSGKLTVRIYPAGALGKGPREQYKRAATGVADITFGLHGYTSSQFPRTLLVELPGIAGSPAAATRGMWNVYDRYLKGEYRRARPLGLWTNAAAVIITRDKPVRALADLQGMKIRVPSKLAAQVLAAWGATPVPMPVPKVYTALNTGVVDGVFIGPSGIGSFKLHEPGNYLTTGLPAMFAAFYLVMNRDSWNALSADQQAALGKATGLGMSLEAAAAYTRAGARGLALFKRKKTVIELSPEEAARFRKAAAAVVGEVVAKLEREGTPAGAIVAALKGGE